MMNLRARARRNPRHGGGSTSIAKTLPYILVIICALSFISLKINSYQLSEYMHYLKGTIDHGEENTMSPQVGVMVATINDVVDKKIELEDNNTQDTKKENIEEEKQDDEDPLTLLQNQITTQSLKTLFEILKRNKLNPPQEYYGQEITPDKEAAEIERCERYGLVYNSTIQNTRRRIFLGSLIADDSWHPIGAHAIEAYGLYHTVALVEGNRTHDMSDRQKRFQPGSLNHDVMVSSGIYGPSTKVAIDLYFDQEGDKGKIDSRDVEQLQREYITKIWKENGMTKEDLGIVSDLDEMYTRDFLLAMQTCDVPQFRRGQSCKTPKRIASTVIFESSPDCIAEGRRWYHPDMIIGECIDGIGDIDLHKPVKRQDSNGRETYRMKASRLEDYDTDAELAAHPPLWKPMDFRAVEGSDSQTTEVLKNEKYPRGTGHTAYHFHNFFTTLDDLRFKYKTYGHGEADALTKPLGKLQSDIDMAVRCVMNRTKDGLSTPYLSGGVDGISGGRIPLVFEDESAGSYRKDRHRELYEMIVADEQQYGTSAPTALLTSSPTSSPTHANATMLRLSTTNSATQADKEDITAGDDADDETVL